MSEPRNINWLGGIADAYGDRNFRIFSFGSIASWTAFFVQIVAISWATWELTGSSAWLAAMALLDIVPNVVLMPLSGALADRYDRVRILVSCYVLLLILSSVLAVMAWTDTLTIWWLAGLVLTHGILIAFAVPCMFGTLPRFVAKDRLSSAIAVNAPYTQFSFFAGPALAGLIIAKWGLGPAFAVNVFGYAAFLSALSFMRTPDDFVKPVKSGLSIAGDIFAGFSYIRGHHGLIALLIIQFTGDALGSGLFFMLPAYSETILGMGVLGVSLVLSMRGIGATGAALWLARGGAEAARPDRVLWGLFIGTLAIALFFIGNIYVTIFAGLVMGFAGETRKTSTMTLVQMSVSEGQRGRIMGNLFLVYQLGASIGTYAVGAIAVSHGLTAPMLSVAGLSLIVTAVLFLYRSQWFNAFNTSDNTPP